MCVKGKFMTEIFSPNMLKTYEKCSKMYFFKYIKGLSMPVDDDIFTFGKNIHALASYYLRGEDISNMEKSLTERELMIWSYLKNIEYFNYEIINTEYNMSVKVGNNFFSGRLDALVKNNEHYYILDYKTGSVPNKAKYDFQTMIYMLCVHKFFKTDNVTFVYIDLKNQTDVKIELSQDLTDEYETALVNIGENIIKGNFLPSKKDCKYCEFGKICYEKLLD